MVCDGRPVRAVLLHILSKTTEYYITRMYLVDLTLVNECLALARRLLLIVKDYTSLVRLINFQFIKKISQVSYL